MSGLSRSQALEARRLTPTMLDLLRYMGRKGEAWIGRAGDKRSADILYRRGFCTVRHEDGGRVVGSLTEAGRQALAVRRAVRPHKSAHKPVSNATGA